ncbi:hypothetical protein V8C26DRAFT_392732, partial [Trichoderma gracile]
MPRSHVVRQASLKAALRTSQAKGQNAVPTGLQGPTCAVDALNAGVFPRLSHHTWLRSKQEPASSLCVVSVPPGAASPVMDRGENWLSSM